MRHARRRSLACYLVGGPGRNPRLSVLPLVDLGALTGFEPGLLQPEAGIDTGLDYSGLVSEAGFEPAARQVLACSATHPV